MEKSTHKVPIIEVKLEPHPNADLLSIVHINDYTVCVKTSDWKDGDLAAYIQPDMCVNTDLPVFTFLKTDKDRKLERITVKKLRGIVSMGLLVPAPSGANVGDDVAALLEVIRYEPKELSEECENTSSPALYSPKYDVDSIRGCSNIFTEGEIVSVSEKIHGANSRYCYNNGVMYCGSHYNWKKDGQNPFWIAYRNTPSVQRFCEDHQNCVLYGEAYGKVKGFNYCTNGKTFFIAFDILRGNQWLSVDEFQKLCDQYGIPRVPELYRGPFSFSKMEELAEGNTVLGNGSHIREGIVIRPIIERTNDKIGRVCLKLVGNGYYEKSNKKKKEN